MKKDLQWKELEKYLLANCKVNDDMLAVNCPSLVRKYKLSRQAIQYKLTKILLNNRDWTKVGEYILIKIKK